jgi:molecular chaperone DnaK
MASDNKSLGRFILDGIPPAPRGIPQVEVSFDVDANGILNVTAKDKTSGKVQSIRIEASGGLKDDEIKKMQAEAEVHKEEDMKKKDLADTKNTGEMMIFSAEKSIGEYGDKISEATKKSVNEKITALRSVKDGTDIEAIKKATTELSNEMSKIGEEMAKAGDPSASSGQADTTVEPQPEEIKDAEEVKPEE